MRLLRDRFDRGKRKPSTRNQRVGFAFFWVLVLAYAYVIPQSPNWNVESHLYVTFALVDHGTVQIDAYRKEIGDISFFHGHYYTDKAPGLSFLAVPVYAALRLAFPHMEGQGYHSYSHRRFSIPHSTVSLRYAITYLLVILPSVILALLLWQFLTALIGSSGWALALTAVYSLGTIAYVYSTWYFSHQISAILLFGAFLALFYKVRGPGPGRQALGYAALAGVAAGYAVVGEYPTIIIAALLGLYLLAVARDRVRAAGAFIAGMIPSAVLLLAYNLAAYGKPFATGYAYVRSASYHSRVHPGAFGLANPLSYGIQPPSLDSFWQITFGLYRGIFPVSPVLLLFFVGIVFMWKRRDLRPEFWLCLGIVVLYFLMDASRGIDQNGWAGGNSVASRHLTPMLPFMIVPMAFGLSNRIFRRSFLALGALSIVTMLAIVSTRDEFTIAQRNPLFHQVLPDIAHGQFITSWGTLLGLTGPASLLPLIALEMALAGRILWLHRRASEQPAPGAVPVLHLEAAAE